MKVLDLVLKAKWYDTIASGEKTEEYREIKPYWIRRLMHCSPVCLGGGLGRADCTLPMFPWETAPCFSAHCHRARKFDVVRFRRGYTNVTMDFQLDGITIGKGRPEWGAPEVKQVFIIKLGKRL